MSLFSRRKILKGDLGNIELSDVLEKLKSENHLSKESYFLLEEVNSNYIIFGLPQQRNTPSEIHEFKYDNELKEIEIKSKYGKGVYTCLLMLILPLFFFYGELTKPKLMAGSIFLIVFLIWVLLIIKLSLIESSKEIERDIVIRINYLSRNNKNTQRKIN